MIAYSKKKIGKAKARKKPEFKVDDVVQLLAPGDPAKKRNVLKPKHSDLDGYYNLHQWSSSNSSDIHQVADIGVCESRSSR